MLGSMFDLRKNDDYRRIQMPGEFLDAGSEVWKAIDS